MVRIKLKNVELAIRLLYHLHYLVFAHVKYFLCHGLFVVNESQVCHKVDLQETAAKHIDELCLEPGHFLFDS